MSDLARVIDQRSLGGGIFLLRLEAPFIAGQTQPGQFMMLRVVPGVEPLLPRPFSIHDAQGDEALILYRVVGRGTALLSQAKAGQELLAWGPLGRGFDLSPKRPVLMAGGMGAAPLGLLARVLAWVGLQPRLLLGLASAEGWSGLVGRMREAAPGLVLASEDGGIGQRGLVTDLLRQLVNDCDGVLACGPLGMLKAVVEICARHGVPCQVSLEAPMACGVGACLGCAIPVPGGYARACQEGPVFNSSDVDWARL